MVSKSSRHDTYPYGAWLNAKMESRTVSNGELARACKDVALKPARASMDARKSAGGEYVAKREIGLFRSGARLPGAEWAYRIGRGLRACKVETTGLGSLWMAASDGFRAGRFAGSRDPLDALVVVAFNRAPQLLEAAEQGLSAADLEAFDAGYGVWVVNPDTTLVSASAKALYAAIKDATRLGWL